MSNWTVLADNEHASDEEIETLDHLLEVLEASGAMYGEIESDDRSRTYSIVRITDDATVGVVVRNVNQGSLSWIAGLLVLTKEN